MTAEQVNAQYEVAEQLGRVQQNGNVDTLRDLIAESLTREDWIRILRRLARSSNIRAAELLLEYRFLRPDFPAAPDSVHDRVNLPPWPEDTA